jgi:hypothetical protein
VVVVRRITGCIKRPVISFLEYKTLDAVENIMIMKQLLDRIAASFLGIILLAFLEGICTLGQAFRFEDYNWIGYCIQMMFVYLAVWVANKAYDAEMKGR